MVALADLISIGEVTKQTSRCVVRVASSIWSDADGVYIKKSIKYLKRKSFGFNLLQEDVSNIGPICILGINNLDMVQDGVYEVVICNEHRDWESGYIDSYDYKLIPFTENNNE